MHDYLHPTGGIPDTITIIYKLSRLLLSLVKAPVIPKNRRDIHSGAKARDAILEKINQYIRSHLTEAPTIGTLADALGYSVNHLRLVSCND